MDAHRPIAEYSGRRVKDARQFRVPLARPSGLICRMHPGKNSVFDEPKAMILRVYRRPLTAVQLTSTKFFTFVLLQNLDVRGVCV